MRIVERILLTGILLIACVLIVVTAVHGIETHSSQPSYSTSDSHFYELLYETKFDSINDCYEVEAGNNVISTLGKLQITGFPMTSNYLYTRKVDYKATNFLNDGRCYEVTFKFKANAVVQSDFTIFNNGEIDIYIDDVRGVTYVYITQYGSPSTLQISSINKGTWYNFKIHAFHLPTYDRFDLTINQFTTTNCRYTGQAATQNLYFGDRTGAAYGKGQWDYLNFEGLSTAQYFNNFNDGNAHEFRYIYYNDEAATIRVNNEALYFDTYISAGPPVVDHEGYIYTEYINYEPGETWRISLDFKITSTTMADFVLVKNRQATIIVDGGGLYYYDGAKQFVMNLQQNTWYFLELGKTSASDFKIDVDNDPQSSNCAFEDQGPSPTWWDYLGIGDFNDDDYSNGCYIDNLKLRVETRTHTDSDTDGLGNSFENDGYEDKVYVWSTDFEDPRIYGTPREITLGELGWEYSPAMDAPDGYVSDWQWGEPIIFQNGPNKGHADGIGGSVGQVLGTILDGNYPSGLILDEGDMIRSPPISLENVQNSAKVTLWHWYDFEQGGSFPTQADDGCQIWIKSDGNWNQLGTYQNPYNAQSIAGLIGPGFSGSSDGWEYLEFDLSNYIGTTINLAFIYRADTDGNVGTGWYIDDIKIFGNLDQTDNDSDGDNLEDGEEFHVYVTSPFTSDSDGDDISDKEEVKNDALADYEFYKNQQTYNSWSDPLTKDIWIEVDEMDAVDNGRGWSNAVRGMVVSDFLAHCIMVHFVFSEEVTGTDDISEVDLEAIGRLKDDDGERENSNNGYYHYLIWAQTFEDDSVLGYTYCSHWFMAVFANHEDLDSDAERTKVLEHVLGMNLGLWHYNNYYKDDDEDYPPNSALKKGIGTWRGFLGDESDWTYTWDDDENDPEDRILGGWDYAHTDETVFVRGLDYSGILKDADFIDVGWEYSPDT